MVNASNPAAKKFDASPKVITDNKDKNKPKSRAFSGRIFPLGIGRVWVRTITASISASYHILSAPEAPAPTAIAHKDISIRKGCKSPDETTNPTKAVKITKDHYTWL